MSEPARFDMAWNYYILLRFSSMPLATHKSLIWLIGAIKGIFDHESLSKYWLLVILLHARFICLREAPAIRCDLMYSFVNNF
jgi:hypothetical protein